MKADRRLILMGLAMLLAACVQQPPIVTPVTGPSPVCTMTVPSPPDPLPPGFDWTPLAQDFCSQLGACGFPTQGCVQDYLDEINAPAAASAGAAASPATEDSTEIVFCEDSVEAQTNPEICTSKYGKGERTR